MIKSYILKKKLKRNIEAFERYAYPEKIEHILVMYNDLNENVELFIGKLNGFFKENTTIHKVHLNPKAKSADGIALNKRSFSFKGLFKDNAHANLFSKTNLIIDLTQKHSLVKNYAISLAPRAYKISLNTDHNSLFQLTIKADSEEFLQFFNEFIKYHNALKHG